MKKRNIISIDDLRNEEITEIFKNADDIAAMQTKGDAIELAKNKIMATLFYEPSTRTRLSFESAMHRIGGSVISSSDMEESSSAAKGETLADTAKVVSQYADVIVIRHPSDGSAMLAGENADVPVINAGDGSHEHPTQTLCDLYTLLKEKGDIKGLTVALCGDLRHGRTIHSLASALARFGAQLVLISSKELGLPDYLVRKLAIRNRVKIECAENLSFLSKQFKGLDALYITSEQGDLFFGDDIRLISMDISKKIPKLDVVYMTRYQKERLARENRTPNYLKVDANLLQTKRLKDAILMHPLPRVDEIPRELDEHPRSKYFKQVSYGLLVRMALLAMIFEPNKRGSNEPAQVPEPRFAPYENKLKEAGPICINENCISRQGREAGPKFWMLSREKTHVSHELILECYYCAFETSVSIVGNSKKKKYCVFDPALEDAVQHWQTQSVLILFKNETEAMAHDFARYSFGPQRPIMGAQEVSAAIAKLAQEIMIGTPNLESLSLVGIKSGGDILAEKIASIIERQVGVHVPVESLNVSQFRDDVHTLKDSTDLPKFSMSLQQRDVILVDDVFFSGRTSRAAMNAIFYGLQQGRPSTVRVAVLIDRGHKELPVSPHFVGKNIPSRKLQRVEVRLDPQSTRDEVVIYDILPELDDLEDRASA